MIADTYTLEQMIGRGGMGAVFLASHVRLPGKHVAIKVLHADVADEEVLARFRHEATIASQLNHPNIVEVHDFNVMPDGTPYLVLEYLEGETLFERLRAGPMPLDHALSIMREVGSALAAAHRIGVIHRDLKPQNIFLVRTEIDGRTVEVAKVLDFGISKMRSSQTVKTQDNALLGTPQYMSPEQAIGQHTKVDERTDVFALGSILYEMLCGHPAFVGASIPEVVFKVVYEQPLPIATEAPTLPRNVTSAIELAMSKTMTERFASVGGFVEALTGEPLALPGPSGALPVVDGPTSVAHKASVARVAIASGIDRTVAANHATVSSISQHPVPVPAPAPVPMTVPPVGAPPSRAPIAIGIAAAALGAIFVYFVMRSPAAAPRTPIDASTPAIIAITAPPHDATVVITAPAPAPIDAATTTLDAAAPVPAHIDAGHVAPKPNTGPPPQTVDDSADSPALAHAEAALASRDYTEAERIANGVSYDPSVSDAVRAAAHVIHGVASCREEKDANALIDLREIDRLPNRAGSAAHARLLEQCHARGLLLERQ